MTTVVILQPGYLPWIGFFDQLIRSDVFVYYDDVQFDKHGWRNRNRVKAPHGPHWLTVPVLNKGHFGQLNLEVEIDNNQPWARKHIGTIRQFYAKAPYLNIYLPKLEELLNSGLGSLVELDMAVVELICEWLQLRRKITRSSKLDIAGSKSERLVKICQHFRADHYLSGDAAKNYLDVEHFTANGISVSWQEFKHPVYAQQHGEFVPYLSMLDMLLNMGEQTGELLINRVNTA